MKDIFEILKIVGFDNRQAFQDVMARCDARVTADEGIPAIIALDDLTRPGENGVFEPAAQDSDAGILLAAKALLFTSLYEQRGDNGKYAAICPAMSAAAESCFRLEHQPDGRCTLIPYDEVAGAFRKPMGEEEGHE